MLILSRKIDEKILIGSDIVITVTKIHGSGRVQLGVEAPKDVKILRGELGERPCIRQAKA